MSNLLTFNKPVTAPYYFIRVNKQQKSPADGLITMSMEPIDIYNAVHGIIGDWANKAAEDNLQVIAEHMRSITIEVKTITSAQAKEYIDDYNRLVSTMRKEMAEKAEQEAKDQVKPAPIIKNHLRVVAVDGVEL